MWRSNENTQWMIKEFENVIQSFEASHKHYLGLIQFGVSHFYVIHSIRGFFDTNKYQVNKKVRTWWRSLSRICNFFFLVYQLDFLTLSIRYRSVIFSQHFLAIIWRKKKPKQYFAITNAIWTTKKCHLNENSAH